MSAARRAQLRLLTDRAVGICDQLDDPGAEAAALRDIRRAVEREVKMRRTEQ